MLDLSEQLVHNTNTKLCKHFVLGLCLGCGCAGPILMQIQLSEHLGIGGPAWDVSVLDLLGKLT